MDEENEVVDALEADLAAEGLDDESLDAELAAYEAELRDTGTGEPGLGPAPEPERWRMPDVSTMSAEEFADFMARDDRFGPDEDDVEPEPRPLPAFMGLSDKAFDLAVERIGWGHTDPFADLDEVS